jgi:predicted phosphodiesterase
MQIKSIVHKFPQFSELEIYGLGDLHIGSKEYNSREFRRVIEKILEKENRYCVLCGDLLDNGIEGSKTSPYSQVIVPGDPQIEGVVEILKPLAGRVLGMTDGNHEQRTGKLVHVDIYGIIAYKLGILDLYRPGICPMIVRVGERKDHHTQPPIYSIGITHGAGAGTTLGAGLTKAEGFALANGFDALIVGHSHKPSSAPSLRFISDYNHGCMTSRIIRIMVVTGWLDYGGYPISKMYKPVAIKVNKLILSGEEYDMDVLG